MLANAHFTSEKNYGLNCEFKAAAVGKWIV